jgi:uncharacterized membrane protein YhaH (DUF805 family)
MNLSMRGVQCIPSETAASRMLVVLATIFVLWIFYCTWAKRLHDIGRSGRLAAVNVVLVCAAGIVLNTQSGVVLGNLAVAMLSAAMIIGGYLLIAPPSKGMNAYGADPRGRTIQWARRRANGDQDDVAEATRVPLDGEAVPETRA